MSLLFIKHVCLITIFSKYRGTFIFPKGIYTSNSEDQSHSTVMVIIMCQVYSITRIIIINNIYIDASIGKYNLMQIRICRLYRFIVNCRKRYQHRHDNFGNINKTNTVVLMNLGAIYTAVVIYSLETSKYHTCFQNQKINGKQTRL